MDGHRTFTRWATTLVALLSLTALAFADGMVVPAPPQISLPGRRPAPGPRIRDAFTVENHLVTIDINGQHATTRVDQKIKNVSGGLAQAQYMFPVPRGANISNFALWIGERQMMGEMMDAKKARDIYEDYVRRSIDPALLEYVSQGLFKTSVFPFQPNETKRLRVQYRELLHQESGLVRLLYPLNTEKFSKYPLEHVRIEVNLKTDKPIATIYSPSHDIIIKRIDDTRVQIILDLKKFKPTTDFELFYAVEEGEFAANMLTYYPEDQDTGYFAYLVSPNLKEASEATVLGKDICFVIDTSGSMLEDGKLVQAKNALEFCLKNLNPNDRFNIVAFSDHLVSFKPALVDNTEKNRIDAIAFATRLRAEGGTAINDALKTAMKQFPKQSGEPAEAQRAKVVLFLTDGKPTIGERNNAKIVKAVKQGNVAGVRLFTFGVGYKVNAVLLDWLSSQNRALTEFVTPKEDLSERISTFYTKIRNPVMTDVVVRVDGVPVEQVHPVLMPDIFTGSQLVVTGKYRKGGRATVTLSGNVRGKTYARETPVVFATPEDVAKPINTERQWIEFLWASRQLGRLIDEVRLNGKSAELLDAIVRLSKRYGIPTEYTSFLVLEDVPLQTTASNLRRLRRRAEGNVDRLMGAEADDAAGVNQARNSQDWRRMNRPMAAPSGGRGFAGQSSLQAGGGGALEGAKRATGSEKARDPGTNSKWFKDAQGQAHRVDNVQNIRGKTFYRRGKTWKDEGIDGKEETTDVEYFSDAFFTLLRKHPELADYAAQGEDIEVRFAKRVYRFMNKRG